MAREPNIFSLLKTVEAFINTVPINPRAANYKKWRGNRTEVKRAVKKVQEMLYRLERIEPREIGFPCTRVPQKFVIDWLTPCRKVLTKYVEPSFLRLCGKIPLKRAMARFKPPLNKD